MKRIKCKAIGETVSDEVLRELAEVNNGKRFLGATDGASVRAMARELLHHRDAKLSGKQRRKLVTDEMVSRFLTWPLPDSVCVDLCSAHFPQPSNYPRSGTNLLTAPEARQMLEYVLAKTTESNNKQKG